MLRCFGLRVPQLLLIISVALPLALVFSFRVTSAGIIDIGTFVTVFTGCAGVFWGGLALYSRDIDRQRHLPDAFMTYVQAGNTTLNMKRNDDPPDASTWELVPPPGEGWFLGSVHPREDGPECYWFRQRVQK